MFRFLCIFEIISSDLCVILSNLRAVQSASQFVKKSTKKSKRRRRGGSRAFWTMLKNCIIGRGGHPFPRVRCVQILESLIRTNKDCLCLGCSSVYCQQLKFCLLPTDSKFEHFPWQTWRKAWCPSHGILLCNCRTCKSESKQHHLITQSRLLEFSISLNLSDLKLNIGTWFWAIRDGSIFQPTPRPGNCRKEQTAQGNFYFFGKHKHKQ